MGLTVGYNPSMTPRIILTGSDSRQRLLAGADIFARTVCATLGPKGRTVMLNRMAGLLATKDGVTVAREIDLSDPVANLACQTFKTGCIRVNDEAGDGTTTTACLAAAILREGHRYILGGYNPVRLALGIQQASQEVISLLRLLALPVETQPQLERVAMVASNGDKEIATIMAEAVMAVGKNGTVSIEDGKGVETTLTFKEGMELDRGPASPHFLKGQTERVLKGPLVACIAATLSTVEDVLDMCEEATTFGGRPLLLFCDGIQGDALKTMVMNDKDFEFVAVQTPGNFQWKVEYLGDIAALSGADVIDPRTGGNWKTWDPHWFGGLRSAHVGLGKTTLVAYEEASDLIKDRVNYIRVQKRHTTSQFDQDKLNERMAALDGGLCIMHIGAFTEAELKEKRARVEDALGAVQGALEEGVVPGGGVAYLSAAQRLASLPAKDDPDIQAGFNILRKALLAPLMTIANNAGEEGAYITQFLLESRTEPDSWLGWDAQEARFRDFQDDPLIIDPVRVAVSVVEAAASMASTLLTSEVAIHQER